MKTKENLKDKTNSEIAKNSNHFLILHNDDVNSFDFVIESLIDICLHKMEQAEQCAFITHYKGKCDIKKGVFDILVPIKNKLTQLGLSVTID